MGQTLCFTISKHPSEKVNLPNAQGDFIRGAEQN